MLQTIFQLAPAIAKWLQPLGTQTAKTHHSSSQRAYSRRPDAAIPRGTSGPVD